MKGIHVFQLLLVSGLCMTLGACEGECSRAVHAGTAGGGKTSMADFVPCDCGTAVSTCTCNATMGYITQTTGKFPNLPATVTYNVDVGKVAPMLVVVLGAEQTGSSSCKIMIDGIDYDGALDKTYLRVDSNTPILVYTAGCTRAFYYYVLDIEPVQEVVPVSATGGTISPPESSNPDFLYRPFTDCLWVFDHEPGSTITLTVESLSLGKEQAFVDDEFKRNSIDGDFLMIGRGPNLLEGEEVMLYGVTEYSRKIQVPYHQAHVYFRSTVSTTLAKGFTIAFNVTEPVVTTTTAAPNVTEAPTAPPGLDTADLPLIGVNPTSADDLRGDVKVTVSKMANEYLGTTDVNATDVFIEGVGSCHPLYCPDECSYYEYSINYHDKFTRLELERMMANQSVRDVLSADHKDWQICKEKVDVVWWQVSLVIVGVIAAGLVAVFVMWKISSSSNRERAQEEYEKQQQQRRNDMRRRSSGNVSILGLGGSISSRGSRRFTMPFPKPNADTDEMEMDVSGYVEYDPDLGRVNPQDFGLGYRSDLMHDPQAMSFYNMGYIEDEENDHFTRGRTTEVADTDSDDSDGGAVSFKSKSKSARQLSHAAEVHVPNNETAL